MDTSPAIDYVLGFMEDTCNEGDDLTQYETVPFDIVRDLRQYVPDTAQTLHRGFSFETEDEAHQFDGGLIVQDRIASWTTNKHVAEDYASNKTWGVILTANIGTSSILVDITRTPINEMVGHTDDEVIILPGMYVVTTEQLTSEDVERFNSDV
jgi:hypothetical protein